MAAITLDALMDPEAEGSSVSETKQSSSDAGADNSLKPAPAAAEAAGAGAAPSTGAAPPGSSSTTTTTTSSGVNGTSSVKPGANAPASGAAPAAPPAAKPRAHMAADQAAADMADMEAIVLSYLRRKGYHSAEKALRNDMRSASFKEVTVALDSVSGDAASLSSNVRFFETDGAVQRYEHSYSMLSKWVHSSLELYRDELQRFLYPLLVHCYLDLVCRGLGEAASAFLSRFRGDHDQEHGEELSRLSSLQAPSHVHENELARTWRTHKFSVALSAFAYELLLLFLHECRFKLLLSLVNQYLNVEVYAGQPALSAPDTAAAGGVLVRSKGSRPSRLNSGPAFWGLFREQRGWRAATAAVAAAEAAAEHQRQTAAKHEALAAHATRLARQADAASAAAGAAADGSGDVPMAAAAANADEQDRLRGLAEDAAQAARQAEADAQAAARAAQQAQAAAVQAEAVAVATAEAAAAVGHAGFGRSKAGLAAAAATGRREPGEPDGSAVQFPRPAPSAQARALEDARLRVAVSAADLPSVCMFTMLHSHSAVNAVSVADDGSAVAACFADSSVRLWDLEKRRQQRGELPAVGGELPADDFELLVGHGGPVYAADFSPDRQWLLTGSEDTTARLWSVADGKNVVAYRSHNYPVWDVAFSALGYYFATASHDRSARLWVTDRTQPVRLLAGHLSDVNAVRFHPNCNYVATASSDKTVRLWDIPSGRCVRLLTGHSSSLHSLAFSPCGKMLAVGGSDGTLALWELGRAQRIGMFRSHSSRPVYALDFSLEGSVLASAGADQSVRLWDVNSATGRTAAVGGAGADGPPAAPAHTSTSSSSSSARASVALTRQCGLATFYTRQTPVLSLKFSPRNILFAAGSFCATSKK